MNSQNMVWKVFVCLLYWAGMALAQVTTGTILGTVSDSTGAVIPAAAVNLRNVETGISRTVTTDAAGRYRVPQLALGSYEVIAEASGFQSVIRSGISLTVGREALVDFTLQVGAVTERITVTGEAPLVETTNATVSNLVNERTMRDLPLNGRSFTDLAVVQPGVIADIGIGASTFGGGRRIVMNGARPSQSLYLLDGTDIVSPYENVAPNSVIGEFLGVETTREFTVIQTGAGAQYGRAMGGIVNAVTRSGTNELHGNVFEFLRNEKLQANDFFLNSAGRQRPPFKRNQFGGTVGGPIKKDSTFFFLAYEALRHVEGNPLNTRVLTKEARGGWITHCATGVTSCSEPVPQTAADTIKVNPDIKPLLDITVLSNLTPPVYEREGTSRWVGNLVNKGMENYGMVRMDQKLSDNDSLFGRFTIDSSELNRPALTALPSGFSRDDNGTYRFSAIEYTHIFSPTVLNNVRIGFNRNTVHTKDIFVANEVPKQAFIMPDPLDPTGYNRIGTAVFSGVSGLSLTGLGGGGDFRFIDNTYIYGDTLNWNPGSHAFAFGGNATRYQMNEDVDPWGWGNPTFANDRNFIQGIVRELIGYRSYADHVRGWRQTYGALFVQDDWQARRGLTLNLGLRWERVTGPAEVNGKMAGLVDMLRDATHTQYKDSLFLLRDPLKGLAPRIGFAWTPFGQKTVLRGAVGVFKEILLEYQYQLAIYQPPWAGKIVLFNPPWPDPIVRAGGTAQAGEPNIMNRTMKYPYNFQWNFGFERQLTNSMVAKATYVGTRSTGLITANNPNQFIPVKKFDSTVGYERWFTPNEKGVTTAPRPNPNWSAIRSFNNIGDAWYHALQLQLEQRYMSGVNYNVSYTFSKNLDTVAVGVKCAETGGAGGSFYAYNLYDIAAEKALSNLHAARNFSLSFGYELPLGAGKRFGSNWTGFRNLLAGGWQVNGLLTSRTGQAIRIINNFDRARNGASIISDRPDLKAGFSNNPVLEDWTVDRYFDSSAFVLQPDGFYGNVPRNTLINPGIINTNLSIFKQFPMGETRDLQFRAEFFNTPNHPNFGSPGNTIFTSAAGLVSAAAGQITSLLTKPRQIQLALKFTF